MVYELLSSKSVSAALVPFEFMVLLSLLLLVIGPLLWSRLWLDEDAFRRNICPVDWTLAFAVTESFRINPPLVLVDDESLTLEAL